MNGGLADRVRRRLVSAAREPTPESVATALRDEQHVAGHDTVLALVDRLRRDMLGAGPLEALLALPGLTDVLVNGPADVFIDQGAGLVRTDVEFGTDDEVRALAQRLASRAGRRLDDASPWVDARLPDGTRLHAVLAPVSRPGTVISLRIGAQRRFDLADLSAMLGPRGTQILRSLLDTRMAFVISGGTGTGKTTLLSALIDALDPAERIIVVEDSSELRPEHAHVVGLESRPANVEGRGAIVMRDLVRQALRMRPDRIVVGEVRGAEVADLLAALNTGHEGGCATIHANAAADVPARMEALAVTAGMPRPALHSQLAAALDVIIHLARDHRGERCIDQIAVLHRQPDGIVCAVPAVRRDGNDLVPDEAWNELQTRLARR